MTPPFFDYESFPSRDSIAALSSSQSNPPVGIPIPGKKRQSTDFDVTNFTLKSTYAVLLKQARGI
jgi:hypothetical protein